jgi:hypothetical protein
MLEVLFPARVRRKVLGLFFLNPEREYYVREIERLISEPFEPIRRELLRFESAGILKSHSKATLKYFFINKNYYLYEELKALITKGERTKNTIKEALSTLWNIKYAFLYEPRKKTKKEAQIFLVVIGNINNEALGYLISSLEKNIKQKIYYFTYSESEFTKKLKNKDAFLVDILKSSRSMLIGNEEEFNKKLKEIKMRS